MTDLVVDGSDSNSNPYLIDSSNVETSFTSIMLKNGGYIKITVPCTLQSQIFDKIDSASESSASAPYDIEIVGSDGKPGTAGAQGANQPQAEDGSNAKCDSLGGACKHYGKNGKNGAVGNTGIDAVQTQATTDGSAAPTVTLSLGELGAEISVYNRGGNGATGGTGGKGGTGQQGGNGGSSKQCGGAKCHGGDGGDGGTGGNGAKGGNGGNGGHGSQVTVTYESVTGSCGTTGSVVTNAAQSIGGPPGIGGYAGDGGAKGSGGGASNGSPGLKGTLGDSSGISGNAGQFIVNESYV